MKIAVIGAGYLGTTHAACMSQIGHSVLAVDIDADKVAKLQSGVVPFFEPELENIVKDGLASGNLRFTGSYAEVADFADVHFLAVGTPQNKRNRGADLSYVDAAIDALCPHLSRSTLIVGKSTVPVGTAQRLAERARRIAPVGVEVELAWNPEFLREGFAVQDTLHPDRIVLGVENRRDSRAEDTIREVYARLWAEEIPFLVTNLPTAELVKVSANAFLATKISFINAIAEVCEVTSADVTTLADAIGCDDRIGRRFLDAGLGFGGGCLSKDIRAFITRAGELGVGDALAFLCEVDSLNIRRRSRIVAITREVCGSLVGARVSILGSAFKPNTDDIRDSPALDVADQIQVEGANVTVYDPKAMDNSRKAFPTLNYAFSTADACIGADAVLVLTEWDEFRRMQPQELGDVTRSKCIIDARNCLNPHEWRAAGWTYRGFGCP
ncbi:UDP-glucose/GDP-mannose dehydrogenase family protein [Mycobacterium sp.]|uniref:UDP-glucose dehydrogenase family protein n=1 Tax=Mycobacterium sp. TaxID=1785 RepID=UPI002BCA42BC|nr:UDP-glucose/GDP-mannose dehydrogenase family protein [Mycobacterium sp.]HKP43770.1 UDP-glucose/GDP-mannose dehydrogenase family protein [Mycobacterium sp.]